MLRATPLAVLLAACCLSLPAASRAADLPAACLAPLPPGSPDPMVRDVHFHVIADNPDLGITACIVSNQASVLPSVTLNSGVFGKDRVLINYAGRTVNNVPPLVNPPAGGPKLVLLWGVSVEVSLQYGQQFAPMTVAALTVGSGQPATFILPVQIDQDGTKPK